jgi:dolichyldiphosphatase
MGRWRDLVVEEDLQDSGWARWEERRRKRAFVNTGNGIVKRKKRR